MLTDDLVWKFSDLSSFPRLVFPFCPFWDFPEFSGIFPICPGIVREFSRFVPFPFLGLLTAPTRNSPEKARDTIRTFPEKSGKPPRFGNPPLSSFSQIFVWPNTTNRENRLGHFMSDKLVGKVFSELIL